MGLNIKLCNIVSTNPYSVRYKSGSNPYPEDDNTSFVLFNTGLTATTITITGLSVNTQYWIKLTDDVTNRYIIKNLYSHDGKAFPCYSKLCFDVISDSVSVTPTPSPTPSVTPPTPTHTPTPSNTPVAGVTLIVENAANSSVSVDFIERDIYYYSFSPVISEGNSETFYSQPGWTGTKSINLGFATLSNSTTKIYYVKTYKNNVLQTSSSYPGQSYGESIVLGGSIYNTIDGDTIKIVVSMSLVPSNSPIPVTPTTTPTLTPTPSPVYKKYTVSVSSGIQCTAGAIVGLASPITSNVSIYTNGENLVNGAMIYSDSALTTQFPNCFFRLGTIVYNSLMGEAIFEQTIGGPC